MYICKKTTRQKLGGGKGKGDRIYFGYIIFSNPEESPQGRKGEEKEGERRRKKKRTFGIAHGVASANVDTCSKIHFSALKL